MKLSREEAERIAKSLNYSKGGLVQVIAQDVESGEVLMAAFANEEAIRLTFETGMAHYWSRSRGRVWLKGETSGHYQYVEEAYVDCDGDAILLKVRQVGAACHTGNRTCFFRRLA